MPCRATLGERAGNRVSANAVNAEVISSRGENLPRPQQAPRDEMAERGRTAGVGIFLDLKAPPKAGFGKQRSGPEQGPGLLTGAGAEGGKELSHPWVIPSEDPSHTHRHPE